MTHAHKPKLSKSAFQAELEEKFKRWGDEGWDLMTMEPVNGGTSIHQARTNKFLVVFKSEKL